MPSGFVIGSLYLLQSSLQPPRRRRIGISNQRHHHNPQQRHRAFHIHTPLMQSIELNPSRIVRRGSIYYATNRKPVPLHGRDNSILRISRQRQHHRDQTHRSQRIARPKDAPRRSQRQQRQQHHSADQPHPM